MISLMSSAASSACMGRWVVAQLGHTADWGRFVWGLVLVMCVRCSESCVRVGVRRFETVGVYEVAFVGGAPNR